MNVRRSISALLALSLLSFGAACRQGGVDDDDASGDGQADDGDSADGSDDTGDSADDGDGDGSDGSDAADDAGDDGPVDDLVDPIGTAGAIDIAAWNIENFPADANTPALVADLITSLGIDLIAVEEIADLDAWDELVERLPDHEGILSFHEYSPGNFQKVGYLYRADLMQVDPDSLLFQDDSFQFPRPPFQVRVTVPGASGGPIEFVAIVLHLKAGTGTDDQERRRQAMITLEEHIRGLVAEGADQVIMLGDYNEILTSTAGRDVFGPFLDAPDLYRVRTDALAQSGAVSFVPTGRMLDHIITTVGLDEEIGASEAVIPPLDVEVNDYVDRVSDHLPVAIALPILE